MKSYKWKILLKWVLRLGFGKTWIKVQSINYLGEKTMSVFWSKVSRCGRVCAGIYERYVMKCNIYCKIYRGKIKHTPVNSVKIVSEWIVLASDLQVAQRAEDPLDVW